MGFLKELWNLTVDPTDPTNGYTPYSFIPIGHHAPVNMSMTRDFQRREIVTVIPSADSVLTEAGRLASPMDRRDKTFSFRLFTNGDNDAAFDNLAAQIAPGIPQRLVYQTDAGGLWFTTARDGIIKVTEQSANNWGYGGFVDFNITWNVRPDWRLLTPELVDTRFSPLNNEVYSPLNDETFIAPGSVHITLVLTSFTMDATGTAGLDLPTLPDTAATFTAVGPMGGDGGILVGNRTYRTIDDNGVEQDTYFGIPFNLPDANHSVSIRLDRQTFMHDGKPFRPTKPFYQGPYFAVKNGVVNNCYVLGLGANILTGGYLTRSFMKKRA